MSDKEQKTITDDDGMIAHSHLDELWFEHAKMNALLYLWTWNLAEIAGSDMILGTEVEDYANGVALNLRDLINLRDLCEYIISTHDFNNEVKTS